MCIIEKCKKQSIYNFKNEIPMYCGDHKKENMINISSKKCIEENCNTRPCFNFENEKSTLYCFKHKKDNMINIKDKDKKCIEENCNKIPNFNYLSEKTPKYCAEHKKENMLDIKNKKCKEKNCNIQPTYNLPNITPPIYCNEHKKENMINVKDNKCIEDDCNTIAIFNYKNNTKAIYCNLHKKNDMINIRDRRCLEKNCEIICPIYNYENQKHGIYCILHKKKDMINVKHKRCKIEECDLRANSKYKNHCAKCYVYLFPEEKISINYKVREILMTEFIKENFKEEKCIIDKRVIGGYSKRRPDCYIDKFSHIIIIECDENQHKREEYSNLNNNRITELSKDFHNRPIIFIRFNPDSYKKDGKNILSSFKYGKSGVLNIRNENEWNNRLMLLKETIDKWLYKKPEHNIKTEYLFYDN